MMMKPASSAGWLVYSMYVRTYNLESWTRSDWDRLFALPTVFDRRPDGCMFRGLGIPWWAVWLVDPFHYNMRRAIASIPTSTYETSTSIPHG